MKHSLCKEDLHHFNGDLKRFQHTLNRSVIYTPGVQHVAESGGAYWLVDAIASYLTTSYLKPIIKQDYRVGEMSFWKLAVADDDSALLEARADSPCEPFVRQEIEYTDFPLRQIDIWAAFDGTHWTLYLPSEH